MLMEPASNVLVPVVVILTRSKAPDRLELAPPPFMESAPLKPIEWLATHVLELTLVSTIDPYTIFAAPFATTTNPDVEVTAAEAPALTNIPDDDTYPDVVTEPEPI